jgi:hypothetical protein
VSARPRRNAPLAIDIETVAPAKRKKAARGQVLAKITLLNPRTYWTLQTAQALGQPLVAELSGGTITIRVREQ